MTLEDLYPIAARIAERLKERGEKVAVADGATGGLLSAALLSVPGALAFYVGGGVLYSTRGRDILLAREPSAYKGMRSATEQYALLQAEAIRDNFGADWGVAESGSAGSSVHPLGIASGRSCAAMAGPGVLLARTTETGSDARIDNMFAFAAAALTLFEQALTEAG